MIQKIAAHLADFTPRLQANTRALYQYCPIPAVNYPQLEQELFVNIYYLKHLCDTVKFPDWPIREPVSSFYLSKPCYLIPGGIGDVPQKSVFIFPTQKGLEVK